MQYDGMATAWLSARSSVRTGRQGRQGGLGFAGVWGSGSGSGVYLLLSDLMRMCVDGASVPCRPSRGAQAGSEPQHDHKHVCGQVQHCRGQCPVSLHCHVQFILFCYTTQVACLSHELWPSRMETSCVSICHTWI